MQARAGRRLRAQGRNLSGFEVQDGSERGLLLWSARVRLSGNNRKTGPWRVLPGQAWATERFCFTGLWCEEEEEELSQGRDCDLIQ